MKYQIMALIFTGTFGSFIAWVKLNGGKVTAWFTVIGDLAIIWRRLTETCADGKAEPQEMQSLCVDFNQFLTDLGLLNLFKKGVSK